jgi:small-conductance mechanosensitive channel
MLNLSSLLPVDLLDIAYIALQLVVCAVAFVLGVVLAKLVNRWVQRAAERGVHGWRLRVLELLAIATGPVVIYAVIYPLTHYIYALAERDPELLVITVVQCAYWLFARTVIYGLVLLTGRDSWLGRRELAFSWTALGLVSGYEWGVFDWLEAILDGIDLVPGKGEFSLWSLIKSLVVVSLFVGISSLISRAIEQRVMKVDALALSTRIGIAKFTYFFLIALGVLIGINAAGVDLTALTVLTGAVGIGLGFGLQSIASNFVSGFVLLMDRSIKPGDVISFTGMTGTSTENFGWVQELRGRYVVVRDRDGVDTLVPNQNLITNPVINWSYSDRKVRLKLPVRISYADDPELALQVLIAAAQCSPRVLRDPEPASRLMHFSDHGIDLELRFWIADPANGVNNVRSDVNRAIWKGFKEAGITIPVAQHDVRMVTARGGGQ